MMLEEELIFLHHDLVMQHTQHHIQVLVTYMEALKQTVEA